MSGPEYTILIKLVNNGYVIKLFTSKEEDERQYVFESIESLNKWLTWYLESQPKGGRTSENRRD